MDRPNKTFKGGKYSVVDDFCYAQFLAFYVLESNPKFTEMKNDCQPEILIDDDMNQPCLYPKCLPLMSSKEKMKCRRIRKVVRYHTPNPVTHAEAYAHHLLMLFFPFRNESDLISEVDNSYTSKLNEPDILSIVNSNKQLFEPFGDVVDRALMNFTSQSRTDCYAQQENDAVLDELGDGTCETDSDDIISEDPINNIQQTPGAPSALAPDILPDEDINNLIKSLNTKQREVFDLIYSWARKTVMNRSSENPVDLDPLQIFITGGAGTGKSHLIKTIFASLTKTLNYTSQNIDKPKVLLLAPTGVAAVNISGNTIHSALGMPTNLLRVCRYQNFLIREGVH